MATSHVTDEELSAAKQRARVLIARQAARAPDDDDLTVVKKALVQELFSLRRVCFDGICFFLVWIISHYLRSGKFFTDHSHRLARA